MILSICIPTYNRAKYLNKLLDSIISQLNSHNLFHDVEIVISDNHSIDNTGDVIQTIKEKYPKLNLKYTVNEKNIGVVRNLLNSIKISSGKYWMFYGDDDILPIGSLTKIISILKYNPNTSVFIFNQENNKPIKNTEKIGIYECARKYFYYMGNACSACINLKENNLIDTEYKNLIKTCWPHTQLMFLTMYTSNESTPVLISEIVVHDSQKKENNNILNAFYYYDTLFYSLIRMAQNISKYKDKKFDSNIKNGIPILHFSTYLFFVKKILYLYKFYSIGKEKNDFLYILNESLFSVKWRFKIYILPIYFLIKIPDAFYYYSFIIIKSLKICLKNKSINYNKSVHEVKKYLQTIKLNKIEKSKLPHASLINKGEW